MPLVSAVAPPLVFTKLPFETPGTSMRAVFPDSSFIAVASSGAWHCCPFCHAFRGFRTHIHHQRRSQTTPLKKLILLIATHAVALVIGFAAGIYFLPVLTAPSAPTIAEVEEAAARATYSGEFHRDLEGSDWLHWGEGIVTVGSDAVALMGKLAPGPDYKLYLAPSFVQTEAEFEAIRALAVHVGDIDTFENFIVPMPDGIDPADYDTVVVWCESFGEFITAATYR